MNTRDSTIAQAFGRAQDQHAQRIDAMCVMERALLAARTQWALAQLLRTSFSRASRNGVWAQIVSGPLIGD